MSILFQGIGGTIQFPKGFMKKAYEIVRENGGLCVSDEVSAAFACDLMSICFACPGPVWIWPTGQPFLGV
jgi:hypothetical protein